MSKQSSLIIDAETQAADVSHVVVDESQPVSAARLPEKYVNRNPDPYMLIERAVEKGLDPAQLKALVDLHEQMRAARAAEEFSAAMNECQAELPLIVKESKNDQTGSLYAKMERIQAIAKPVFTKHGFALSFAEEDSPIDRFKRTICDVRHRAGHCVRYHLDLPLDGFSAKGNPIGSMNPVQAAISTGTYAQRYLTCRVFNITVANTDLDGRPAELDNAERDSSAPSAEPRGKRSQPVNPLPETAAANEIRATWRKQHFPGEHPAGFLRDEFGKWFCTTVGADSVPVSGRDWHPSDFEKCAKALGIDNPMKGQPCRE